MPSPLPSEDLAEESRTSYRQRLNAESLALAREWRRLGRAATAVAVITSPVMFTVLYSALDLPIWAALLLTILGIAAFRGAVDIIAHWFVPSPSIYGAEKELADEDILSRRRLWYWRRRYRQLIVLGGIFCLVAGVVAIINAEPFGGAVNDVLDSIPSVITQAPGLFVT